MSFKLMEGQESPHTAKIDDTEGFFGKLFYYSLNSQGGTLVDTRAYRGDPRKTDRSQQRVKILTRINSSESLSVAPRQEVKIKFYTVLSFPNPNPLVN